MWFALIHPQTSKQKLLALLFWLAALATAVVLFVYGFPPLVHHVIEPFVDSIQKRLSPAAIAVVVILANAVLPLVFLPATPFVWLAAIVLGIAWAIPVTIAGCALGMLLPFMVTRCLAQKSTLQLLEQRPNAVAILEVIRKAGPFKVIFLLRVGPAPYSLLSYVAGIPQSVRLFPYMAASTLGMLPANVVDVVFGRNLKGISDLLTGKKMEPGQLAYNLASMFVSIAIAVGGYVYARQALHKIRQQGQELAEPGGVQLSPPQEPARASTELSTQAEAELQQDDVTYLSFTLKHTAQPTSSAPLHVYSKSSAAPASYQSDS